jgi:hypothetical protein
VVVVAAASEVGADQFVSGFVAKAGVKFPSPPCVAITAVWDA